MKLFKKTAIIILLCSLCVSMLTGCGKENKDDQSDNGKKTYQKGTLTTTDFQSEYLGLKFTAPEGYIMATEEDIDSLIQFSAETIYTDASQATIDYAMANTVYEMMVSAPIGVPNTVVTVEKLSLSNMTEEQYIEELKLEILKAEGVDYSFGTISSVKIAGQSYSNLTATFQSGGVEGFQDYYIRKIDNRMVGIIITYTEDTRTDMETLLAAFVAL